MRPKKLTICGWGPYKKACEIDFTAFEGKGLFLITGPTGAGKTTIFDAVCFALYGVLSGDMREKSSVRSDFAEEETKTYVELWMEHGGKEYRIYRNPEYERLKKRKTGHSDFTRERENAILYFPDGSAIEGSNEVTRRIQEILVLDYKQFKQISMLAQGEFARLLTAPAKEKTAIFREIFGTGIYEQFGNALRQRSKQLYMSVSEIRHKLEEDIRLLSLPEEEFERLKEAQNLNFEQILEYLFRAEKEYKGKQETCERSYRKLDKQLASLAAKISKAREYNGRLLELQQAREKLALLIEQEPCIKEKEKVLEKAKKAGFLETAYLNLLHCEEQLQGNKELLKEAREEKKQFELQQKELYRWFRDREELTQGIALREQNEQLKKEETESRNQCRLLEQMLGQLSEEYLASETDFLKKKQEYEEADIHFKRAVIGITASLLKDGEPCPVCGSLTHPSPAPLKDGTPDEKQIADLKEIFQSAQKYANELYIKTAGKKTELEGAQKGLEELLAKSAQNDKRLAALAKKLGDLTDLPCGKAREQLQDRIGRYQKLIGLIQEKNQQIQRLEEELLTDKELLVQRKAEQKELLKQYGFSGMPQFLQSKKTPQQQQQLEEEIRRYRDQTLSLKKLVSHLGSSLKSKEKKETDAMEEKLESLKEQKELILKQQKNLNILTADIVRTRKQMKENTELLNRHASEYGYVKDLDNVAGGINSKRLVFEQYVLASYFEEILSAANLHFTKMTGGRYEMSRPDRVGDGRTRDNLEIQVFDFYTGKYRLVKTLSGGEAFKASLALALGMSDVIQSFHGGIRVDTLFVDEGFGSLDSESLDQACQTLSTLVEKDRLIGIISHVPELRERIDSQLIVQKTNGGSTIEIMV